MIVTRIEDEPFVGQQDVLSALKQAYGAANASSSGASQSIYSAYTVSIRPVDGPPFQVSQLHEGQLSIDGTPEQNARAAAAIRNVLPASAPRIIALSEDLSHYVDLTHGITAEEISRGWTSTEGVDFSA